MVDFEMGWRNLLFANWSVEPEVVARYLPDALSVDTYDGRAWLSVVAFRNVGLRPRGVPKSAGYDLPELNLRTYVTAPGHERPGILFYNLDADGLPGVLGARLAFGLPYFSANIRMDESDGRVRFASERTHRGAPPLRFSARYEPSGERFRPRPGTRAEFLAERRRLYTMLGDGSVRYLDVEHPRWSLSPAEATIETNEAFKANNIEEPDSEPICYYSPGVDVVGHPPKRLEP